MHHRLLSHVSGDLIDFPDCFFCWLWLSINRWFPGVWTITIEDFRPDNSRHEIYYCGHFRKLPSFLTPFDFCLYGSDESSYNISITYRKRVTEISITDIVWNVQVCTVLTCLPRWVKLPVWRASICCVVNRMWLRPTVWMWSSLQHCTSSKIVMRWLKRNWTSSSKVIFMGKQYQCSFLVYEFFIPAF